MPTVSKIVELTKEELVQAILNYADIGGNDKDIEIEWTTCDGIPTGVSLKHIEKQPSKKKTAKKRAVPK